MEAWLLVPIRLVGVAFIALMVYFAFDGVTHKLAVLGGEPAPAVEEETPGPATNFRVVPLALGALMVAVILIAVESRQLSQFRRTVEGIERLDGSIRFDPPATSIKRQYYSKIATVDLSDTGVTDQSMPDLRLVPKLRTVRLANTQIGAGTVRVLGECGRLERIDVSQTKLTGSDLAPLTRLQRLRVLLANDTSIDDKAVGLLSSCKTLGKIELTGTRLTDAGFERLRQALPTATISRT